MNMTVSTAMDVEEQDVASTSASADQFDQYRCGVVVKLRQYYSEFLMESAEVIGTLLSRLEISETPVEGSKDESMGEPAEKSV